MTAAAVARATREPSAVRTACDEALELLASSRHAVPSTLDETLDRLDACSLLVEFARDTSTPVDVLDRLALSPVAAARLMVASNPAAPDHIRAAAAVSAV